MSASKPVEPAWQETKREVREWVLTDGTFVRITYIVEEAPAPDRPEGSP